MSQTALLRSFKICGAIAIASAFMVLVNQGQLWVAILVASSIFAVLFWASWSLQKPHMAPAEFEVDSVTFESDFPELNGLDVDTMTLFEEIFYTVQDEVVPSRRRSLSLDFIPHRMLAGDVLDRLIERLNVYGSRHDFRVSLNKSDEDLSLVFDYSA